MADKITDLFAALKVMRRKRMKHYRDDTEAENDRINDTVNAIHDLLDPLESIEQNVALADAVSLWFAAISDAEIREQMLEDWIEQMSGQIAVMRKAIETE